MKNTIKILAAAVVMICVVSCQNKSKPNYQYMPNMYEPVSYETYGDYKVFPDSQEAMLPVEGSIPRGWMPYEYENSNNGYLQAKDSLKNPIRYTKENEEAGKELYDIYCAICHGGKGDGKGTLVKREKILGVPTYSDVGRAITEGSIYHVMYYGINSMGSYASQTSEHERWQIVQYVQKLKADLEGKTPRIDTEVVEVVEVVVDEKHEEPANDHQEPAKDHSNAH
ncbi:c-type cytochrome [Aquimarina aquimarini]|uniref:c-type cytochrome n=1 Tax=Aquimarina aquimarini TaxID=1191734 RepID=UPI000D557415|nr:cytochrome c [Aquimarina aquimarini]